MMRKPMGAAKGGSGKLPAAEAFLAFLRRRGERVTRARLAIMAEVMSRHDHFRADEVAAKLASEPSRVSRGTVYRTLSLMEEAGLVRVMRDQDMHRHYEHVFGHEHHDHMVCNSCGRISEFTQAGVDRGIDRACRRAGFAPDHHRLVIFGICRACQRPD